MTCEAKTHDSARAYEALGCRCPEAREAHRVAMNRYRLALLRGQRFTVPSAGTVRRIQALVRLGWPMGEIAHRIGWQDRHSVRVLLTRQRVTARTARQVAAVYDKLSMTPGPSNIAAGQAKAKGWPPPLAWDDDTIDDPNAKPHVNPPTVRQERAARLDDVVVLRLIGGERTESTMAERREAAFRLLANGVPRKQIAERLGVHDVQVDRWARWEREEKAG